MAEKQPTDDAINAPEPPGVHTLPKVSSPILSCSSVHNLALLSSPTQVGNPLASSPTYAQLDNLLSQQIANLSTHDPFADVEPLPQRKRFANKDLKTRKSLFNSISESNLDSLKEELKRKRSQTSSNSGSNEKLPPPQNPAKRDSKHVSFFFQTKTVEADMDHQPTNATATSTDKPPVLTTTAPDVQTPGGSGATPSNNNDAEEDIPAIFNQMVANDDPARHYLVKGPAADMWKLARESLSLAARSHSRLRRLKARISTNKVDSWALGINPIPDYMEEILNELVPSLKQQGLELMKTVAEKLERRMKIAEGNAHKFMSHVRDTFDDLGSEEYPLAEKRLLGIAQAHRVKERELMEDFDTDQNDNMPSERTKLLDLIMKKKAPTLRQQERSRKRNRSRSRSRSRATAASPTPKRGGQKRPQQQQQQ